MYPSLVIAGSHLSKWSTSCRQMMSAELVSMAFSCIEWRCVHASRPAGHSVKPPRLGAFPLRPSARQFHCSRLSRVSRPCPCRRLAPELPCPAAVLRCLTGTSVRGINGGDSAISHSSSWTSKSVLCGPASTSMSAPAKTTPLFLELSVCVCPEPVLVKRAVSATRGETE